MPRSYTEREIKRVQDELDEVNSQELNYEIAEHLEEELERLKSGAYMLDDIVDRLDKGEDFTMNYSFLIGDSTRKEPGKLRLIRLE